MKRQIVRIVVVVALVCGVVACVPSVQLFDSMAQFFDSMVVYGAESSNTTAVEGNIMAVFYTIATVEGKHQSLFWVTDAQIIDSGDGKWDVVSPQRKVTGVNQALVSYGLYKYKPLPDLGSGTYYLEALGLQGITWDDLKKSMHIAGLIDVYLVNGKPRATVRRFYMGKTYDIPNCRVSQTAYDNFNDGKIKVYDSTYGWLAPENEDCFVAVYFMSETPFDNELMIPVIIDKVIK